MSVTNKPVGGGSGAVASSAHAACARFKGTDPLITGIARRRLAGDLGHPDTLGKIPEARWMRAMTFERLVRDPRFASEVATTVAGSVGLGRPTEVVIANAHVSADQTAGLLVAAHERAVRNGAATLIYGLAVPFVGFGDTSTTDVRPDFAVVAPNTLGDGSWLIAGDAKDYERMRSRIDDGRLLKGFLQVAVGAESFAAWSKLPAGMSVHQFGALAVPRNAFLQPEVVIEDLADHRGEVAMRVGERRDEAAAVDYDPSTPVRELVSHLRATFDPISCPTCALFNYCRSELRGSESPSDLLVELGIPAEQHAALVGLVDGTAPAGPAPASSVALVTATVTGRGEWSGQRRIDPAGLAGTVNVLVAKSDSAVLGVHGVAVQRVTAAGRGSWTMQVFEEPQSQETRRAVMKLIGTELTAAIAEMRKAKPERPEPVHLVVPDAATANVLASMADNLAGVELSRLRWERDLQMGRDTLTFNGELADIPLKLRGPARTAVSFLLEEDRARALKVRSPVIDAGAVLRHHLVAGGPLVNAFRLDYLVEWASPKVVEHRLVGDRIELSEHTPGARLANPMSDQIHAALVGRVRRADRSRAADPDAYARLVTDELTYKREVLERTLDVLDEIEPSNLSDAYRAIEGDAQAVWRRRLELRASDLVRFGRTYRWWRNSLVESVESDARCNDQLLALTNPHWAEDRALAAGARELGFATVVAVNPLVLDVDSRRTGEGSRLVLLYVAGEACVEAPFIQLKSQAGDFKIDGLSIGPVTKDGVEPAAPSRRFVWDPKTEPLVSVGDRLIVADFGWFSTNKSNRFLSVSKPKPDGMSAPKADCEPDSYETDPEKHRFCCRPHEIAEAEFSDILADRRARGELNPQTWPPIRDTDGFEVAPAGTPIGDADAIPAEPVPEDMTMDDVE